MLRVEDLGVDFGERGHCFGGELSAVLETLRLSWSGEGCGDGAGDIALRGLDP